MILDRRDLGRGIIEVATIYLHQLHIGIDLRQTLQRPLGQGATIDIAVAIAVRGGVEEGIGVLLEEADRMERLNKTVVALLQNGSQEAAILDSILIQAHLLLRAGHDLHIDAFRVGREAPIGQVALLIEIGHLEGHRSIVLKVINIHPNPLRGHARHRITNLHERSGARRHIQQGKFGYAAFILAIEGHLHLIGRQQPPLRNAKFVATHHLTTDHSRIVVVRDAVLLTATVAPIEIAPTVIEETPLIGIAGLLGTGRRGIAMHDRIA